MFKNLNNREKTKKKQSHNINKVSIKYACFKILNDGFQLNDKLKIRQKPYCYKSSTYHNMYTVETCCKVETRSKYTIRHSERRNCIFYTL